MPTSQIRRGVTAAGRPGDSITIPEISKHRPSPVESGRGRRPGAEDRRAATICRKSFSFSRGYSELRPHPITATVRPPAASAPRCAAVSIPRAPARCTQCNVVQSAFWLLWQRAEEAA
ncbi:hypothetical protein LCGC14_1613480 [marine sediment metagenome]|uniref:Uncharacterized protein n=1 Tax=marine sediment metagenome TaxID=412755 RepID=A0A0F9IUE7_9ZZZZ